MSVITILENRKFCKLDEDNKDLLFKVHKLLSYKVEGVQYTPAYRDYGWDGTTYIMNKKREFPNGLLPLVQSFYKENNLPLQIADKRIPTKLSQEIDLSARLKELDKEPYYYQVDAVKNAFDNERGIIKVATGGGKSLIAAMLTAKIAKKTVIFVIGKELLYQFHAFFSEVFQKPIGIVGDGKCDIQDITIASIWTVGKVLGLDKKQILAESEDIEDEDIQESNKEKIIKYMSEVSVAILDECHICNCFTIQAIYKAMQPERWYGLSGTPMKGAEIDLVTKAYLGETVIDISATLLIKEGFLAQPIIKFIMVPACPIFGSTYNEIYKEYIVENDTRNKIILDQTKMLISKGYQVLILFGAIKHGKILQKMFKDDGEINFEILDGSDKKDRRKFVKDRLMNKEVNCILASKIYDIGVDIPSLSALILASGGKSSVKAMQRIGRVIRKYSNKKHAAVVDFLDNAKYLKKHSKIRKDIYQLEDGFKVIWPQNAK